jgi:hypothetical protein
VTGVTSRMSKQQSQNQLAQSDFSLRLLTIVACWKMSELRSSRSQESTVWCMEGKGSDCTWCGVCCDAGRVCSLGVNASEVPGQMVLAASKLCGGAQRQLQHR